LGISLVKVLDFQACVNSQTAPISLGNIPVDSTKDVCSVTLSVTPDSLAWLNGHFYVNNNNSSSVGTQFVTVTITRDDDNKLVFQSFVEIDIEGADDYTFISVQAVDEIDADLSTATYTLRVTANVDNIELFTPITFTGMSIQNGGITVSQAAGVRRPSNSSDPL